MRHAGIGGEGRYQDRQLIGWGMFDVQQDAVATADPTRATREIAERLLTNLVPKITSQLPRFFQ